MKKIIIASIAALTLSGCSAYVDGTYQTLTVNTEPPNAVCEVHNQKGIMVSSIVSGETAYDIRRSNRPITVTCSKKGYADTQVTLYSEADRRSTGHVFLSGVFPDLVTGTNRGFYPHEIDIVLRR